MFISSRKCLDVNSWLDFGTEKYAWDLAFGPTLAVCLNFQSLDSFTSTNLPRKAKIAIAFQISSPSSWVPQAWQVQSCDEVFHASELGMEAVFRL